jgi:hypothetical protein
VVKGFGGHGHAVGGLFVRVLIDRLGLKRRLVGRVYRRKG